MVKKRMGKTQGTGRSLLGPACTLEEHVAHSHIPHCSKERSPPAGELILLIASSYQRVANACD